MLLSWQHGASPFLQLRVGPWVKQKKRAALLTRDGSQFSNIRIFYLIIEYRLGCVIIF